MIINERKLKTSQILAECKKKFVVWSSWSDKELDKQFPIPKKLTTREFRDNVEADEEFKNLSANDLKEKYPDKEFITLRERLIMELEYFKKTGKHLDIENTTLCAGSRRTDGFVPCVYWYPDDRRLGVGWCGPGVASGGLRSREVVKTLSLNLIKGQNYKLTEI